MTGNRASKCMKQNMTEFKGEIDNFIIIVDLHTSVVDKQLVVDRNKTVKTENMNNTINHLN